MGLGKERHLQGKSWISCPPCCVEGWPYVRCCGLLCEYGDIPKIPAGLRHLFEKQCTVHSGKKKGMNGVQSTGFYCGQFYWPLMSNERLKLELESWRKRWEGCVFFTNLLALGLADIVGKQDNKLKHSMPFFKSRRAQTDVDWGLSACEKAWLGS